MKRIRYARILFEMHRHTDHGALGKVHGATQEISQESKGNPSFAQMPDVPFPFFGRGLNDAGID